MTESETTLTDESSEISVIGSSASTLDDVPNITRKHQKADIRNSTGSLIQLVQIGNVDKELKEDNRHMLIDGSNVLNGQVLSSNAGPSIDLKSPVMEDQQYCNQNDSSGHQTVNSAKNVNKCCQQKSKENFDVDIMKNALHLVENAQRIDLEKHKISESQRQQNCNVTQEFLCGLMQENMHYRDQLRLTDAEIGTLKNNVSQLEAKTTELQNTITGLEQQLQASQNDVHIEREKITTLEKNNEAQAKKITELQQAVQRIESGPSQAQINFLQHRVQYFEARDIYLRQHLMRLQYRRTYHAQTAAGFQIPPDGLGVVTALPVQSEFLPVD